MGTGDVAAAVALRLAGATDDELDGVVADTLAMLGRKAVADRTYITLYHDDRTFENSHEWTAPGVVPQLPAIQRLRADDFSYSYELARRGEVLAVPDLNDLPPAAAAEHRSFSSFGIRAVLQVPIVVNREGVALIGFNYFHTDVAWSDELIEFIRGVGQAIVVAVIRQRSARSISRVNEELARAKRAKDDLLAHFSHELRTPLHAMLGYAELLELDGRSDRDRNALMEIQFHGRHLLAMVDDLISLAADPGDRRVELVDVGPLVATTLESLAPVAALRRIAYAVRPGVQSAVVRLELGRVRQVLHCVLSGAVQSLPAGATIAVDIAPPSTPPGEPHPGAPILLELSAPAPIKAEDVVMPLAEALIDGHGSISVMTHAADRLDVIISFGAGTAQVASP